MKANDEHSPRASELPFRPGGCDSIYKPRVTMLSNSPSPFTGLISFRIQQPCKKLSLQQVGVRKDGRMSLETEGESDKNREPFSGGQTREGRREEGERGQKKYVSLPNFVWGSSQTCSAAFK